MFSLGKKYEFPKQRTANRGHDLRTFRAGSSLAIGSKRGSRCRRTYIADVAERSVRPNCARSQSLDVAARLPALDESEILARRPGKRAFAEKMEVQMRNAFARIRTTVDDDAITAFRKIELLRYDSRSEQ